MKPIIIASNPATVKIVFGNATVLINIECCAGYGVNDIIIRLSQDNGVKPMSTVAKYLPGFEPAEIKPLVNTFTSELNAQYPSKIIDMSCWDHERLDAAAGYLTGLLGFNTTENMLRAYGYEVRNQGPVISRQARQQPTRTISSEPLPHNDVRPTPAPVKEKNDSRYLGITALVTAVATLGVILAASMMYYLG